MKIFVTGATGFVGRAFCRMALERGHRVLALCRNDVTALTGDTEIASGDLQGTPWRQVEQFEADAVVHLAWIATPGVYLTSPENEVWLEQSKTWFQRVQELGIKHIVGMGTCIEYAASTEPLNETLSPLTPTFPYSRAKVALFEWLRDNGRNPSTVWTWLRLFYPYGPGEHPSRISSSLIQQLRTGKCVALRTPHSVKDFVFIDDVASAICEVIGTKMTGAVNVGTGQGISITALATRIAELLHVDPALVQHAAELSDDPTPLVIANTQRLRGIGWSPRNKLDAGLQQLIQSMPMAA
jgi:nucleoside-diphosphate-sugar epimerase